MPPVSGGICVLWKSFIAELSAGSAVALFCRLDILAEALEYGLMTFARAALRMTIAKAKG
jgi:hypothetical protein